MRQLEQLDPMREEQDGMPVAAMVGLDARATMDQNRMAFPLTTVLHSG